MIILLTVQSINFDEYYPMMRAGLLYSNAERFNSSFSSEDEADETVTSPDNIDDG